MKFNFLNKKLRKVGTSKLSQRFDRGTRRERGGRTGNVRRGKSTCFRREKLSSASAPHFPPSLCPYGPEPTQQQRSFSHRFHSDVENSAHTEAGKPRTDELSYFTSSDYTGQHYRFKGILLIPFKRILALVLRARTVDSMWPRMILRM